MVAIGCVAIAALVSWPRDEAARSGAPTPNASTAPARALAQPSVQGRRIAGIVVEEGTPAAGARVLLSDPLGRATIRTTGTDGRFEFGAQAAAAFAIVAEMPMRAPAIATVDLRDPRTDSEDVHLVLHACDASLRGTIRDAAGGIVPHARVALPLGTLGTSTGVEANDAGAYELCVPVGPGHVAISADGYARATEPFEAFGVVRRDFTLVPAATIAGRVLRARDRSPVGSAIVEIQPDYWRGTMMVRPTPVRVITDDDGAFQASDVMPGPYVVIARADGLYAARGVYTEAETGEAVEIECLVGEAHVVRGKVVEAGRATPIAGAVVMLRDHDDPMFGRNAIARSQTDGSFAIEVPPGTYEPAVLRSQIVDGATVVVENRDLDIVLAVAKRASISGRITRDGKPVDDADVSLRGGPSTFAVRTDHEGRYVHRDVEAGTYSVYAESKRVGAFARSAELSLANGESRVIDVELALAGSVSGIVVDQHGAPVGGVYVRFSLLGGDDFGVATTAEDGTFRARAMAGGGEYVYEVRPSAQSQLVYPPAAGKRYPPIAVRDGRAAVAGLRIQIRREQLALAGRVLATDGKPIAGARITVAPSMYDGVPLVTDETGAWTATGLPAGLYNVIASYAGREEHEANVAAGRRDVVLTFGPTGTIEGAVEGFTGDVDLRANVYGNFVRPMLAGNAFRIRNVEPGHVRVTASSKTGFASEVVEVTANATTTVTLRATSVGRVSGRVVYRDGRPAARVSCEAITDGHDAHAMADDRGSVRLEGVSPGIAQVTCAGTSKQVMITSGGTATFEIVIDATGPPLPPAGYVGVVFERQLEDTRVHAVVPNGPAARAGIAVGDVVVKVDSDVVNGASASWLADELAHRPIGTTVKITIERGDATLLLELKVEAAP